jgi:hypothetical protein
MNWGCETVVPNGKQARVTEPRPIRLIMRGIPSCVVSVHSVRRCGTPLALSGVYPAREYKRFQQLL